ncbi:Rrf2 family transcriptional regulator [Roseofilum casamattae]|uniref:RrF2 family transcriptional regulator n=1 Tax=Roseofilum casamattae BLCC-M143 TaxID=3022442 RepID=A0ABT7BW66_9CYAN|nr:RrF2 family transcriptional regulator [Roseofilum casamattae]MDJ1183052.1 RrF2 family transcriptional regulator [Roseofilum casamattae BLCC-M143]
MKLTTRGHYSVKALLDLSLQPGWGPSSVRDIATRQDLPAPYLEKLLIQLRAAGLVYSVRGARGGYGLAHQPARISLGQILEAVGETLPPLAGLAPNSDRVEDWVTHALWKQLYRKLKQSLYTISLEDLYFDARSWQASQGESSNFVV